MFRPEKLERTIQPSPRAANNSRMMNINFDVTVAIYKRGGTEKVGWVDDRGCFFSSSHVTFPTSGQAVVTGVVSFPPRFLHSMFIAHRGQQSHCSSIFHRPLLLTRALALSASQFALKLNSLRIYTGVHSGGLRLKKLTYTPYQARG